MSSILFCETDMDGFREKESDIFSNFQLSGLMRKNPDIFGLRSWDKYSDGIEFNKYKIIWIHCNPRVMKPFWYDYPRLIRNKAEKPTIVIDHEYDPYFYQRNVGFVDETTCYPKIDFEIKRGFIGADYYYVSLSSSFKYMPQILGFPVIYSRIGEPHVEEKLFLEPIEYDNRDGIVTLSHSVVLPMSRRFDIIKKLGLPATIISTNKNDLPASKLREYGEFYGLKDVTYLDTLPWEKYLEVVRQHKIAFDIDYIGMCRFAYECGKMNVPIVSLKFMEIANILYPELIVKNSESMVKMIKNVYNNKSYHDKLNKYSSYLFKNYFSRIATEQRTKRFLEKIGVRI